MGWTDSRLSDLNIACAASVAGILRDHTPDPLNGTCGKIWSDLHGDMQRPAEMTGPPGRNRKVDTGE